MGADRNPLSCEIHYSIQELDARKGGVPLGSRCTSRVTQIYNRHAYLPEKQEALAAWEKILLGIVAGGGGGS